MRAMETDDIPHTDHRKISGEWWRFLSEKKAGRLVSLGVHPLSWAYGCCLLARRKLYSSKVLPVRRLPCKVISVGNLTLGGTGKTPTVISIARTLAEKGVKTAVISRGYRGKYTSKTAIVSDGESVFMKPEEAGDEPYMMARALESVPVIVGRDRYMAGLLAWEKFNVQAVLLDDGYQQLGLAKDLNILLVNRRCSENELRLFPLGGLRESLSQTGRADVILYTMCREGEEYPPPPVSLEETPTFMSGYKATGLRMIKDRGLLPLEAAVGKRVLAFCGIARPGSFLDTLKEAGLKVVDFVSYPDHHYFASRERAELTEKARAAGAEMIVTTEKDAVKIEGFASGEPPFLALMVEMALLGHKEEWEWFLMGGIEG